MTIKLALVLLLTAVAWALITLLALLVVTLPDCVGNSQCAAQKDFLRPVILVAAVVSYIIVAALMLRSGEGRD